MKKLLIGLLCLFFHGSCTADTSSVPVHDFANYLRKIIISNNTKAFKQLYGYDDVQDEVECVFGTENKESKIIQFLKKENISILATKLGITNSGKKIIYVITYYDSAMINFNKKVTLNDLEKYWKTGYLETRVWFVNNKWQFGTAFYCHSSPPWVGEYGINLDRDSGLDGIAMVCNK